MSFETAVLALAVGGVLLHTVVMALAPLDLVVTLVPDDAFYYLNLARHHARSGRWTFDGGATTTTGFHLLHAYAASAFYRIAPAAAPTASLVAAMLAGGVMTAIAAALTVRALARVVAPAAPAALLAVPFVFLAGGSLQATTMAMEWPYAVLCGALGLFAVLTERPALAAAAGVLGTLARSDFPALAVAAGVASLAPWSRGISRRGRMAALAFAGGAVCGLGLVLAHTWLLSGELFQASARIKAHWSRRTGYSPLPGLDAMGLSTPLGYAMLWVLDWGTIVFAAVLAPVVAWLARGEWRAWRARVRVAVAGAEPRAGLRAFAWTFALLAIAGYALVYGFNSAAAQAWYSADVVIPLVVLHAAVIEACRGRARRVVIAAFAALTVVSVATARRPLYEGQLQAMQVGRILASDPPPGRLAAWNAGTYAFFSGLPIVNIDGLVNDEVVPYVVSSTLACYLVRKEITAIVDADGMFRHDLAVRGGYGDGLLARHVTERPLLTMYAGKLALYTLDRAALAAVAPCP